MLYLIGGAARAGKSTVARRFLAETGVPFFCLDYLMMGVASGLPESGVDPDDGDELRVAERLWPMVNPMATAMLENGETYLLEGVQMLPQYAGELSERWPGQVRSCFLGYAEIELQVKLGQLREFEGGTNDWMSDFDDEQMCQSIEYFKTLSAFVRDECARYNLLYIETAADFPASVERAVAHLKYGAA
ncbi:MAG: hypothetical protein KJZ86_08590 [Caldilineaceae bacterium]|nr:hypothetical protein [Caldilineaceae bacterium]HRJ45557.1 hypothetical protein [Caldilineaceae bacterium]